MSYIKFDKTQLVNLEYSLSREFLRSNRAGSFASSTIVNCHTRKYHGLLICPLDEFGGTRHVLVSSLDETIIQHEKEFHLSVRKYPGKYHPGHKYIREFEADPMPWMTYRVGGVILKKEMLLVEDEERMIIRYTLLDAHSPTTLRLHPFLAFRNIHTVGKANHDVKREYDVIENGIKTRMYEKYPFVYLQTSQQNQYVSQPEWYYNIEYTKEQERGYDYQEDLFVPGHFDIQLEKGVPVVFSLGTSATKTNKLNALFDTEVKKRVPRDSFENCLANAARQFIMRRNNRTDIISGFPWFGSWGRDTFIAAPGLTLSTGDAKTFKAILDTAAGDITGAVAKNEDNFWTANMHNADASLWFFWALQQYLPHTTPEKLWKDYGKKMLMILRAFRNADEPLAVMHDNGLIYIGNRDLALTWMDAIIDHKPVTPRYGYVVEINALWYNAVMFLINLAGKVGATDVVDEWIDLPERIKRSFLSLFWDDKKQYLPDFVDYTYKNWQIRPNQIFAASMPYSMLDEDQQKAVIDTVKAELLCPRGLRTLTPRDESYKPVCAGTVTEKDLAYHNGTAWPWLFGAFADAYLRLFGRSGLVYIERIYKGFEEEIGKHGIGTISEIYDGNPPHEPRGAISQAWSVGELLRVKTLIEQYKQK